MPLFGGFLAFNRAGGNCALNRPTKPLRINSAGAFNDTKGVILLYNLLIRLFIQLNYFITLLRY